MSQVGNIGPFEDSIEDFEGYVARVKLFFIANDVKQDRRVATFLTLAGAKIYTLAKSLLSPDDPGTATLDDLVKVLSDHFKPKTIIIFERYKFYSRSQKQNETVADFVAGIKRLAHTCDFGNQLNDMLRDRFVMGLQSEATQHILLAESNLTFQRAVEIATAREAAHRDVQAMGHQHVHKVFVKHKNKQPSQQVPKQNNRDAKQANVKTKPKLPCTGCGQKHWRNDCPYKHVECYLCKKKGHLQKMCFQAKKTNSQVNSLTMQTPEQSFVPNTCDSYDYIFTVNNNKVNPILMNLLLNDVNVQFEVDTGAARSLMSKETYEKIWPNKFNRPVLNETLVNLKVYGGSSLRVEGEVKVDIKLSNCADTKCTAALLITADGGPSLLGRDLLKALNLTEVKLNSINASTHSQLLADYPELFSPGLGCLKDHVVTIDVDQSVSPKYCKARTVPYALRDSVDQELDRLVREGIISPITSSPWAAAIVPVLKQDKSIRICGDYKLTVNKAAKIDSYPIPKLEDLFSKLGGSTTFTKLDMSQAYAQLLLDEKSKPYTVINTHKGLFAYNRLCFGISSAPGIFQRTMETLLKDIPGVCCYLDDVLISGSTQVDHDKRLNTVLNTLQSKGIKLKLEKCAISVGRVEYLGYVLDKDGIHPTNEKIKAIKNAPRPTNETQLRSYLGLLNFYRRFIPKAATVLHPLNELLKANQKFNWGKSQEEAFNASKNLILNSTVLVHFDTKLPIVVVADSSSYGIGAVLCHLIDGVERPVFFASRTLTSAEKNYSQLEKEALAMTYALRKFHYYLWGQKNFTVITDHKPLLGIFSATKPIPPLASGRIQRWALLLQAYDFTLRHRSGQLLGTADALSRLPLSSPTDSTPVPADWTHLVNFLDASPVTSEDIRHFTRTDPFLSKVHRYCEQGWPSSTLGYPDLQSFARRRDELSIQNGCVLWGTRVIVPSKLRPALLQELHAGHAGSSRMKELARSYIWWPGLDKDLEDVSSSCSDCLSLRPNPPKAELHPWEWPSSPWHRIHVDYAGPVNDNYFLIIVDAHSKWVDVYCTKGMTAQVTIKCLRHSFSSYGLPVSLVSDNGPCFISHEFKEFIDNCGIRHITTAVYKPSTNGLAERMVQTFKRALRHSKEPITITIDKFLYNYRMTPHSTTGVSPAELMFGRKLRSRLDLLWPGESVATRVADRQKLQKSNHSTTARSLTLPNHAPICIRNYSNRGPKWVPAEVQSQTGPLSYKCTLNDGVVVKRHQDQIIPSKSNCKNEPIWVPQPSESIIIEPKVEPSLSEVSEVNTKTDTVVPPPVVRRSSRVSKPVDRLNL